LLILRPKKTGTTGVLVVPCSLSRGKQQVTVKETQEVDSEGPTQLGVGETVDDSARIDLSEFYVDTETQLDQPIAIDNQNDELSRGL
jgi:hypothetical protein